MQKRYSQHNLVVERTLATGRPSKLGLRLFLVGWFVWGAWAIPLAGQEPVESRQSRPNFSVEADENPRPNLLWLSTEDIGPQLNCYGDATAKTPALDRLAKRGVVYDFAWSNYPVCAPARTTIITGMYAAALGAGNMRSLVHLPTDVELFPGYLRQAGYYCTNNSKTDYNVRQNKLTPWDESSKRAHYRNRQPGQPFFAVFNYTGTHESQIRRRPHEAVIDPAEVKLPTYWPDKPEVRRDYAQYYDNLQKMDQWIDKHLRELQQSGEADNTIVMFFGDHGSGMPRHKRFAGDSGMRVPMIVHVPERWLSLVGEDYKVGKHSQRPIGFVDFAPSMLSVAGVEPPSHMQGRAFLGQYRKPTSRYLYGFRDRMDERPDVSRSIRDQRFLYLRNFMPHLPAGQLLSYQLETPTTRVWKTMYDAGKLNPIRSQFWKPRSAEALYDLQDDPEETINLAGDRDFADVLQRFRDEHRTSYRRFGDLGLIPESTLTAIDNLGQSPREVLRNPSSFNLEAIFELACLAADQTDSSREKLAAAIESPNPTLCYWGLLGALIAGQKAYQTNQQEINARVADANPAVAIVASELAAAFGSQDHRKIALDRLAWFADYRQSNVAGAVAALNAIDRLGKLADPIRAQLAKIPKSDPKFPRGKNYIRRLLESVE